jgi:hypothetical protein
MSGKRLFDELMEAVAFAEAGETGAAGRIASRALRDRSAGEPPGGRILAVSAASVFSPRMVEGAVGMAERLRCGLVALTLPAALSRLTGRLGPRAPERSAWLSAEAFAARAAARGIPFVHAAQDCAPEEAVADARRRFRRIAFLVIDPALTPPARFATVSIPVLSLAGE